MFALDALARSGRNPIDACRTHPAPSILLTILLAILIGVASGQAQSTDKSTETTEFIRYGASVDTRTAWPGPLAYNGQDLVWVITADAFAFDLAHAYFLLNDSAMYLLPPLLKRTHADLIKARDDGARSTQGPEFAKAVKQIDSVLSEFDPELWDLEGPEYGRLSSRARCIESIRALLTDQGPDNAPFGPEHLSEATARLWVRYAELIRTLWGDERCGFPGWALKVSWEKLGMPQRSNSLTFPRGGILPRVGDFLNFSITQNTSWAKRPGWGNDGVFCSASSTRNTVLAFVETGARDPASTGSFRGTLWTVLNSMLDEPAPVRLPEDAPLSLPLTQESADEQWSRVRTESTLASAALIRRGTLDSLVRGTVLGGRGYMCKPPRLFVLYAIDSLTWRALEQTVARLKDAQQVVLDLQAKLKNDSPPCGRHGVRNLESVARWRKALSPLAEARNKQKHLLIRRLSLDEKLTGLIKAIGFSNNQGLRRNPTTRPLADPTQALDRIPAASWLRAAYLPQPLRRVHFRFLLNGEPVEGIGVAPILKVKNPAADLKALHELWSH